MLLQTNHTTMLLLPGALCLLLMAACGCTREAMELGSWYNGSVTDRDVTTLVFDLGNKTSEVRGESGTGKG